MLNRTTKYYAILGMIIIAKLAIVVVAIPNLAMLSQGDSSSNYNISKMPDNYPEIANNLLNGNGYRVRPDTAETMIRPPVNIFLLAAVFSVFGESLAAVQVINVFLTVAGGLLLMKLVRKRTHDPVIAGVAAAMFV